MKCFACGFPDHGLDRCEVAARKRAGAVVHEVVHAPAVVVHAEAAKVIQPQSTRHGKYADAEARRLYRRDWMARKRAELKKEA